MATSLDFIEYVAAQATGCGDVRYKKMFGEYMVYIDDKIDKLSDEQTRMWYAEVD